MSGFLSLAQAILTMTVFAQGVATTVMKKEIQDLVAKYQAQFDCIQALNDHMAKLGIFQQLLSQLKTSMTFSAQQWTALASDLDDRKSYFDSLMTKMNNIKLPSEENKWGDYTAVFFTGVGAAALWNLYIKQTDFAKVFQSIRMWCQRNRVQPYTNKAAVQGKGDQIEIEIENINGNRTPQQVNSNMEQIISPKNIPQSAPQSKEVTPKIWNKITVGFHFVVVVGLIIGVAAGIVDIVQLVKEKKYLGKAFGPDGDFKTIEEGVIELMKFVSINLYQISNTSKCVLNDLSKLFLTKSIFTPKYFDKLYTYAKKLTPDTFKITDNYITQNQKFMTGVVSLSNGKDSNSDKLFGLKKLYDGFMGSEKPNEIFLNIAQVLSQAIGNYSLSSGQIDKYEGNQYRFLNKSCKVLDKRNSEILQCGSDAQRKTLDTGYLNKIIQAHYTVFEDEQFNSQALKTSEKKLLYYTIGLYTNNFYSDDTTGKSIFTYQFSKIQDLKTYGQIFQDYNENPPRQLKISYQDAQKETAAKNEYIAQIKTLSKDNASTIHPLYRYITYVEVDNPQEKDEQKQKYVRNIEGMKYTVNADQATVKNIERDFEKQNFYLVP